MKRRGRVSTIVTKVIIAIPSFKFRRNVRRQLDVLEGTIETMERERERALRLGAENFAHVYEVALFLTLLSFDMTVLVADHALELRYSRKNFYSRQLCLLLFEAFEDIPSVFGKQFRTSVQGITAEPKVLTDLGAHIRGITVLSRKYSKELKEVRTVAAAHREHDVILQLKVIRALDDSKVGAIAKELDMLITKLVLWLIEIAREMGKARIILRNVKFNEPNRSALPTPGVDPDAADFNV